jgi:hypothetical protein
VGVVVAGVAGRLWLMLHCNGWVGFRYAYSLVCRELCGVEWWRLARGGWLTRTEKGGETRRDGDGARRRDKERDGQYILYSVVRAVRRRRRRRVRCALDAELGKHGDVARDMSMKMHSMFLYSFLTHSDGK